MVCWLWNGEVMLYRYFLFNDTATTEIYTLSLPTLFRSESEKWKEKNPCAKWTFHFYNQPRNVLTEGRLSLFVGAMTAALFVSVCVGCSDSFPSGSTPKTPGSTAESTNSSSDWLKKTVSILLKYVLFSWKMYADGWQRGWFQPNPFRQEVECRWLTSWTTRSCVRHWSIRRSILLIVLT